MKKRFVVIGTLCLALIAGLALYQQQRKARDVVTLTTATAEKGSITTSISATGTIEPIDKVEVGTQVSGVLEKVYVDFNATVKKGELIAEIDKKNLLSSVVLSRVTLDAAKTDQRYQEKNLERNKALFAGGLISQEAYDQALYAYEKAATVVEKAAADLKRTEENLGYANIYSPIDGIVLSRAVEKGQTVAASLNAPTLFIIAHDLTKMNVLAAIDEADIGQIAQGMKVTFFVDAHPEEEFTGEVTQIRLQPTITSNVVTYTVNIVAENPELKLMPGMTATIAILTREVHDAVTIPVKALRFQPNPELLRAYALQNRTVGSARTPRPDSTREHHVAGAKNRAPDQSRVWIKNGIQLNSKKVNTGLSDGISVAITGGLREGDEVVVSMTRQGMTAQSTPTPAAAGGSPFMPSRNRQGSGKKR